jgi:hypothetical protein
MEIPRGVRIPEGDRSEYALKLIKNYAGCPVLWTSRMQTEIALSSTEAKYVALSQSMREVIPLMELMREAAQIKLPIVPTPPKIHCKLFEDNSGVIKIARVPKMRPRTKHLNINIIIFVASFKMDPFQYTKLAQINRSPISSQRR